MCKYVFMIFNCYINNENVLYITILLKLLFVVITTIVFIFMETKCKYNKKKKNNKKYRQNMYTSKI